MLQFLVLSLPSNDLKFSYKLSFLLLILLIFQEKIHSIFFLFLLYRSCLKFQFCLVIFLFFYYKYPISYRDISLNKYINAKTLTHWILFPNFLIWIVLFIHLYHLFEGHPLLNLTYVRFLPPPFKILIYKLEIWQYKKLRLPLDYSCVLR